MLTIKTVRNPSTQARLFEEPDLINFPSLASARTRFGEAAEELACEAFGLDNIPTDGRFDVCFDAQDRKGNFFEIKSVRQGGAIPLWNWRIEKDRKAGVPLFYIIVQHKTGGVKNTHDLWDGFAKTVKEIFIVPLGIMETLHSEGKLVTPKTISTHGSMRKGYCEGYKLVPTKKLESRIHSAKTVVFKLYGHTFNTIVKTLI